MENRIRGMFRWLPDSVKATLEFYFDKSVGKEFGGAFNGQVFRQQIFVDLIEALPIEAIVETGTFRGVTTEFLANVSNLPVHTVEAEPRFYHFAKLQLRGYQNVEVNSGDSRNFILRLAEDRSFPKANVFFYLDAHWNKDLPLFEEVELIGSHWKDALVMIDDFKVNGDGGYKFDDYGGKDVLSIQYLKPLLKDKWAVFFPKASSNEETGLKRGSVVIASRSIESKVKQLESLRFFNLVNRVNFNEGSIS